MEADDIFAKIVTDGAAQFPVFIIIMFCVNIRLISFMKLRSKLLIINNLMLNLVQTFVHSKKKSKFLRVNI